MIFGVYLCNWPHIVYSNNNLVITIYYMGQSSIILKKSIDDYLDIPKRQEEKITCGVQFLCSIGDKIS